MQLSLVYSYNPTLHITNFFSVLVHFTFSSNHLCFSVFPQYFTFMSIYFYNHVMHLTLCFISNSEAMNCVEVLNCFVLFFFFADFTLRQFIILTLTLCVSTVCISKNATTPSIMKSHYIWTFMLVKNKILEISIHRWIAFTVEEHFRFQFLWQEKWICLRISDDYDHQVRWNCQP